MPRPMMQGRPKETKPRYWIGEPPTVCDTCKRPITTVFYDCKTSLGPWGNLDADCFAHYGYGTGTGIGQEYTRQQDGRWLKTAG